MFFFLNSVQEACILLQTLPKVIHHFGKIMLTDPTAQGIRAARTTHLNESALATTTNTVILCRCVGANTDMPCNVPVTD